MTLVNNSKPQILAITFLIIGFACAPVWYVGTFVNQDGSPHIYNAYLIGELLKGNQAVQNFAELNSNAIPNLTGHWLLAGLLAIFGPVLTTKIAVTGLFALFVGSMIWLRQQTAGKSGLVLCLFFTTAIGFNWPWLLGFYNFILALSLVAFTLGLWWRWRDRLTILRATAILILLLLTFFSHLVSFGLLGLTLAILSVTEYRRIGARNMMSTLTLLALTAPFVFNFLLLGLTDGTFQPTWRHFSGGLSSIISQLSAADPFSLMTRRSVPFVKVDSRLLAIFAPSLWIVVATSLLALATVRAKMSDRGGLGTDAGWIVSSILFLVVGIVGPDDLGTVHGGYLRERFLIVGMMCSVPFLRFEAGLIIRSSVSFLLAMVIVFQVSVIWEYAFFAEKRAESFLAAKSQIGQDESLGSVIFVSGEGRFRSMPTPNLSPILGIGKSGPVWDNYELGYYLFPVVSPTREQKTFVAEFREVSTYNLDDPKEDLEGKLKRLEILLETENQRFSTLLVWNGRPEFDSIRTRWFDSEPYFVSGDLKLYRHK